MLRHALGMAWKVLGRRKVFTGISLFGIGLTLTVLMVAAAMLDHVFGADPPETRLHRTLGIYGLGMVGESASRTSFPGYAFLEAHARDLPGVEEESFFRNLGWLTAYPRGRKVTYWLKRTDGAFWEILEFVFVEGRPLAADDVERVRRVAVINESTRDAFFGGGPAVGRTLDVEGMPHEVVGVVRDVPFLRFTPFADVWAPLTTAPNDAWRDEVAGDFQALLLARSRADFPEIRAAFESRIAEAVPAEQEFDRYHAGADTYFEFVSRAIFSSNARESHPARLRAVLATAAVLFMLLPSLNLVNLNLSRILERSGEIGVRKAFGASARALTGQFLVENVVLTLLGGAVGLALAALALEGLEATGWIPHAELGLNLRIFAWGLGLALGFGLLSGVYPAWRMSRLDPVQALRKRTSR